MASSILSLDFGAIQTFEAVPKLRNLCSGYVTEFEITGLQVFELVKLDELYVEAERLSLSRTTLSKDEIQPSNPPLSSSLSSFASAVHFIATQVFKNLSHVLELPWERYLEEMHEQTAPSGDSLRLLRTSSSAGERQQLWSTLTIIFTRTKRDACLLRFGAALEVFSQGFIKAATSDISYPDQCHTATHSQLVNGDADEKTSDMMLVYDLRPSVGVVYSRMAGAKMKPLSSEEMAQQKRVRGSSPYVD